MKRRVMFLFSALALCLARVNGLTSNLAACVRRPFSSTLLSVGAAAVIKRPMMAITTKSSIKEKADRTRTESRSTEVAQKRGIAQTLCVSVPHPTTPGPSARACRFMWF